MPYSSFSCRLVVLLVGRTASANTFMIKDFLFLVDHLGELGDVGVFQVRQSTVLVPSLSESDQEGSTAPVLFGGPHEVIQNPLYTRADSPSLFAYVLKFK
jgi:hypothetical protein